MRVTGCIFTEQGWVNGTVDFDTTIVSVTGDNVHGEPQTPDRLIIPGFIDLHVHGGGGADVMQGRDAVLTMAQYHATQGTVALTPTTMTAPTDHITHAIDGIAQAMAYSNKKNVTAHRKADILGVHLEGPFISSKNLGAQPNYTCDASVKLLQKWHDICPIRVLTLAPEIADADVLAHYANNATQARVQIGHTVADYTCCKRALQGGGFSGATHLYNAMSGLSHRDTGAVAGIFSHSDYAEIILDTHHVAQGAVASACRAIPYVYSVTDATSATGQPDGEYVLGNTTVYKQNGTVRLPDGTLAGSCLTMIQSFKNWLAWGATLTEAVHRTATYPAQYLNIREDYGSIDTGRKASFVIMNSTHDIEQVYINGDPVL